MKRLIYNNKQLATLISLFVLILVLVLFRQNSDFVEQYYYGGLYLFICHIMRPVFNLLPLSLGDVFYTAIIVWLLIGIYKLFRFLFKKQFKPAGKLMLRFLISRLVRPSIQK